MAQTILATLADVASRPANQQVANYTLVLTDAGKAVEGNAASALSFTVPPNSSVAYPTGTIIEVVQLGAGAVTLVPGSGVTITGDTVTPGQGGSLLLRKTATNAWFSAIASLRSGTYAGTPNGVPMVAATRVPGEYVLTDYGTVDVTGVANSNAAWAAAVAAWYAGGGGTIKLPAGRVLVTTQTIVPSGNPIASDATTQPPLTIKGVGGHYSGQNTLGSGGSRLILTYQGAGDANPMDAQIVTRGLGVLTFDNLVLQDTAVGTNTPFCSTTNTTIKTVNGCAFLGADIGTACKKDAFILGGTMKHPGVAADYDDPNSAFQGYGTSIKDGYYNRIRRSVYGRAYCNHTVIADNMMDKDCGTNLVGGACVEFDGSTDLEAAGAADADYAYANVVTGNYFHWVGGYYYQVKLRQASRTFVGFNGGSDPGPNHVALVRCESVTDNSGVVRASFDNEIVCNYDQHSSHLSEDAGSAGKNYLIAGGTTEGTVIPGNVNLLGNLNPIKIGAATFSGSLIFTKSPSLRWTIPTWVSGAALTIDDADGNTWFSVPINAAGAWEARGALTLRGNAVGAPAGTTTLTIGNNSTASEALLKLNAPTGQVNRIVYSRAGVDSWWIYDANSTPLYFRDQVNGVMQLTVVPGAGTAGRVEVGGECRILGALGHRGTTVGFNNTAPIAKRGATADATDLATVITLANALKADLVAYGLKVA